MRHFFSYHLHNAVKNSFSSSTKLLVIYYHSFRNRLSEYMRLHYTFHIRLNTNGLSDLIYNRSTAQEICSAADSISISLNMPDAKSYTEVVRPIYGEKAFEAMLQFAQDCKKYLNDIRFSVVDVIGRENIEKCQLLADSIGILLYVREYS